jgi:5-methylcytosine-specific restriction endonuclease McrA
MRFELVILLITAGLVANVYTDGKFLKKLWSYQKYYKMTGIAFGGLMAYWLLTKNPKRAGEMFATSHEYLKYLPVDQETSSMLSPILDFTSKQNFSQNLPESGTTASGNDYNVLNMFLPNQNGNTAAETRMMRSGKSSSKRSVSETKKKYVASRQNWTCGDCSQQLSAWFEVDHKVRLEYGGSNHIDNLVALCRECHGKKTTIENL